MLIFKMLSCQQVATLASDHLDKHNSKKLGLGIRLHLMMCANCRRFVRHLKLTQSIAPQLIQTQQKAVDAEAILRKIKERNL